MPSLPTIYQMYMENNCQFGFYVHRDSWREDRFAMVAAIDGVEDGQPIEGEPPYYNRMHPAGHPKAGQIWARTVYLEAPWFDNGTYKTDSGGVNGWRQVYPG